MSGCAGFLPASRVHTRPDYRPDHDPNPVAAVLLRHGEVWLVEATVLAARAAFADAADGPAGIVYLLHFDRPYVSVSGNRVKTVSHYLGWTVDLPYRLAEHAAGRGARLLAVITAAGIGFTVARTWTDVPQWVERRLKRRKNAARFCPACDPTAARRARYPFSRPIHAPAPSWGGGR